MILAHEWPLMSFTLFSQLAAGMFIVLMILKTRVGNKDAQATQAINLGITAVGPITLVAAICSLFHLGDPLGAPRSIYNLASSWLSREIIFISAFLVLWFAYWYLARKGKESLLLGWITAVAGLLCIYSMSHIYSSSIRPAWDNLNTFVVFYGTTIALGVLGSACAVVYSMRGNACSPDLGVALKYMVYLGVAAVIVPLVYLPVFLSGLNAGDVTAVASAQALMGSMGVLVFRVLLSLAGLGLLLFYIITRQAKGTLSPTFVYFGFLLILFGEFLGRYLFYLAGLSPIIGG